MYFIKVSVPYYIPNFQIQVTDERGYTSYIDTGVPNCPGSQFPQGELDYLAECNPTKTFTMRELPAYQFPTN